MALLPTSLGIRPRLAIEVRPAGVVAARADENSSTIAAFAHAEFPAGTSIPLLRPGVSAAHASTETSPPAILTAVGRDALVAAVRKSLDSVCQRGRDTTLVVPDSAVRVLLLDFDELPSKPAEALPVVRFRLKKLLPFEADDAAVSYQVMSATRGLVRVLAVAMPREILADYESIVREAGFEPGAVLPSTLAALAGLPEGDTPRLLINIGRDSVTTAIVRAGLLLLHRSIDLRSEDTSLPDPYPSATSGYLDPVQTSVHVKTAALVRETTLPQEGLLTTNELAQAISVAAAYFEDTLDSLPDVLLTSGTLSATALESMLAEAGITGVPVREVVNSALLGPGAAGSRINMGLLAGVQGALAS